MNRLIAENLSVVRGGTCVLHNISISLDPGQVILVTGPSGCGKTTLANCLSGLIPQHFPAEISGNIFVNGTDIQDIPLERLSCTVGYVPSSPWGRFFQITVADELAFGLRNSGCIDKEIKKRIEESAEIVGLGELLNARVDALSGGQKQRLSLAIGISMQCRFLVLDEPTSGLDIEAVNRLVSICRRLTRERSTGIIIFEHRISDFVKFSDVLMIMQNGRMIFSGSPKQAEKSVFKALGIRRPEQAELEHWRDLIQPDTHAPETPPVLSLRNVCASWGKTRVLDHLNFDLYPGTVTALVGDNGAGKTTLSRVISGLHPLDSGQIHFSSRRKHKPDGRITGLLMQNPEIMLFCRTVLEELKFGPENYAVPGVSEWLPTVMDLLDLETLQSRNPQHLSAGQKLRTALGAVLTLQPRILILDEPIYGQDWSHLTGIMQVLRNAIDPGTGACLLITHEYKLVHHFADRIALIRDGRIALEGTPRETYQ